VHGAYKRASCQGDLLATHEPVEGDLAVDGGEELELRTSEAVSRHDEDPGSQALLLVVEEIEEVLEDDGLLVGEMLWPEGFVELIINQVFDIIRSKLIPKRTSTI
jgi:hypothetical protein